MHRAGVGRALDLHLVLVAVFPVRHVEDEFDLADAVGLGAHFLVHAHGHAAHIDIVLAGKEGHNGHGAGTKGGGAQFHGIEAVQGRVGLLAGMGREFRTALKVLAFDV